MKVIINKSIAGSNFSYRRGQVVEMPSDQAKSWIKGGNASEMSKAEIAMHEERIEKNKKAAEAAIKADLATQEKMKKDAKEAAKKKADDLAASKNKSKKETAVALEPENAMEK